LTESETHQRYFRAGKTIDGFCKKLNSS